MEQEHDGEDDERRYQGEAGRPLDLPREVQKVLDRLREHDDQGDREAHQQRPVLTTDNVHGNDRTVA